MPDPFWLEMEAAFNAVSTNPSLQVDVQRGDKTGIVKYNPQMDCIFIKITAATDDSTPVEINPAAKKESD